MKHFSHKMSEMPQDELEHLRAILTHAYDQPRKEGVRNIVRRIAKGFFVTPKEVILKRAQVDSVRKDSSKEDAA